MGPAEHQLTYHDHGWSARSRTAAPPSRPDVYGNITNILTTVNGSGWNRPVYVSPTTNRLVYAADDAAGNQLTWDGAYTYGCDSLNMMISQQSSTREDKWSIRPDKDGGYRLVNKDGKALPKDIGQKLQNDRKFKDAIEKAMRNY